MSFFSTPLSGLSASSASLKAISNNLANMNTDGYKSQTADFSDVFYQNYGTSGSGDPIQSGLGVQVNGTTSDLSNGAISATGVSSNLALDGSGYFVTSDSSGALAYTRAGDFTTNTSGQLVTLGGNQVMGYPAVGSVVNNSAPLQSLNVGAGTTAPANSTSTFSLTANLDSTTAINSSTTPSNITLYDSLGASHLLTVSYTKTADNTWSYTATVPSTDIKNGTGTTTTVGTGTLNFDNTGALTSTSPVTNLSIGPLADGAGTMTPTWTLAGSNGTGLLTQTASKANTSAATQNGYAAGTLANFNVLSDGTVEATFTNGQNRAIGQVAVANFANPEGLSLQGGNQYAVTSASGAAVIGTAGTGGRGIIDGSKVEASNVDVATEFAKMIVAQRAYEANAKAITAFDQVEQATIAMKS